MMSGPEAMQQIEGLKQEVTRLKCDKLDLLRQNVVSTNCVAIYAFVAHMQEKKTLILLFNSNNDKRLSS